MPQSPHRCSFTEREPRVLPDARRPAEAICPACPPALRSRTARRTTAGSGMSRAIGEGKRVTEPRTASNSAEETSPMAKHSVPHNLRQEKARQVADAAFANYKERLAQYNPEAKWVSDTKADISFGVRGISLHGSIELKPASIDMELEVPLLLRPFQGIALKVIEQEVAGWVEKANAGEI
jgi:hypothetical protein